MCRARRFVLLLVVLSWLGLTVATATAQSPPIDALQQRIVEVTEQATPAIVEVQGRGAAIQWCHRQPAGARADGGPHDQSRPRYTVRLTDGRRLASQALGICEQMQGERLDCGLIKITEPQDLPCLPLGSSARLRASQPCLSISYPGGQVQQASPLFAWGDWQIGPWRADDSVHGPDGARRLRRTAAGSGWQSHRYPPRIGPRMDQNYDVPIDVFKTYWDQLNVAEAFRSGWSARA